jgi:hypothetical protein
MSRTLLPIRPTLARPGALAGVVRAELLKVGLGPVRARCVEPAKTVFLGRWPRSDSRLAPATGLAYIHSTSAAPTFPSIRD